MLEPRQADLPALFLFLVVLPVVVYILLGKWSEASRRKEKISLLVEETPLQSFGAETMAAPGVIPVVPLPNAVPSAIPFVRQSSAAFRVCAQCGDPAKTRCSRCKSVRYCSGKCQIMHWRQGHKDECLPPDNNDYCVKSASEEEETGVARNVLYEGQYPQFTGCPSQQTMEEEVQCDVNPPPRNPGASSATVDGSKNSKLERRMLEKRVSRKSSKEMFGSRDRAAAISGDGNPSTEAYTRHKQDLGIKNQNSDSMSSTRRSLTVDAVGAEYSVSNVNCLRGGSSCSEEVLTTNSFPEMVSSNGNITYENKVNVECVKLAKSPKSVSRATREQVHSAKVRKGHGMDESEVAGMGNVSSPNGTNGTTSVGLLKVMGLKKSKKIPRQETCDMGIDSRKKVKVLFPYEDFTRYFEDVMYDLAPRGLMNCGNSCYANAVLQCLTCTRPLVMYLLSRTHSRTRCSKNWCLMCELEQHVMMLKEAGGPLSPSRIMSHIRRINCQIGDGSQEDAHEFLRLLVASMQSICLEEVGGESQVHPSLQETTFVQQTFGGRLRSMVTCLKCHHESERYENIMDLTLEIYGWVESLEDALTQFTRPEDLDGENMYRCGRCASYVRARKQLSIDEAPNILTIVLKRFQEGNYGKINKCISFPEMLDMIPFMTRTNDMPPLYMLYGVVVHVDTLNASFSGHYVSYVKDLQGNWYRIDDSVVQPVPMSQVMSEGAYILFYKRSYPRPPRGYVGKATRQQQPTKSSRHYMSKAHNSSEMERSIHRNDMFTPHELNGMEFCDSTSSDWSLFTSSDEASFTSESTRDSFSTADYSDTNFHVDPFSSQRTISCRMFSGSKPVTRFVSEEKGYIFNSEHQNFVNYDSYDSPSDDFLRTFSNCRI